MPTPPRLGSVLLLQAAARQPRVHTAKRFGGGGDTRQKWLESFDPSNRGPFPNVFKRPPPLRVRMPPPVGYAPFHESNPIYHNMKIWPEWYELDPTMTKQKIFYRSPPPGARLPLLYAKWGSAVFIAWVLYRFYWDYAEYTGEWYPPCAHEWTDEELGIPPDDGPDPEYWGRHFDKDYDPR